MRGFWLIFILLLALFAWAVQRSGTIVRVEHRENSGVPGMPQRRSVEYQWHWDRFERYLKSCLPR